MLPLIKTILLNKNTKRSWESLLIGKFLRDNHSSDYLYYYQDLPLKNGNKIVLINYINALRACRHLYKPKPKPLCQAKWWLDVRKGWRARGVPYNLLQEINFK